MPFGSSIHQPSWHNQHHQQKHMLQIWATNMWKHRFPQLFHPFSLWIPKLFSFRASMWRSGSPETWWTRAHGRAFSGFGQHLFDQLLALLGASSLPLRLEQPLKIWSSKKLTFNTDKVFGWNFIRISCYQMLSVCKTPLASYLTLTLSRSVPSCHARLEVRVSSECLATTSAAVWRSTTQDGKTKQKANGSGWWCKFM